MTNGQALHFLQGFDQLTIGRQYLLGQALHPFDGGSVPMQGLERSFSTLDLIRRQGEAFRHQAHLADAHLADVFLTYCGEPGVVRPAQRGTLFAQAHKAARVELDVAVEFFDQLTTCVGERNPLRVGRANPICDCLAGRAVAGFPGPQAISRTHQPVVYIVREIHAGQLPGVSAKEPAPVCDALIVQGGEYAAAALQAVVDQQAAQPSRGFPEPLFTQAHRLAVGAQALGFEPPGGVRRVPAHCIPGVVARDEVLLACSVFEHTRPLGMGGRYHRACW
ncbi:hypothetical protein D3C76_467400 [compost metagenome]